MANTPLCIVVIEEMGKDAPEQQKRHELGIDNEQQQHACDPGLLGRLESKANQG